MLTSLVKISIGLFAWMGGIYGVLQIGNLHTRWDHVACGPWGCGPTVPAMTAYHLFWLMLLLPPAAMVARVLPEGLRDKAGWVLMALGAGIALAVVAWQAVYWLPIGGENAASYFVQRCLFSMATLIDVPMAQIFLAGMLFWAWPSPKCAKSPFVDTAATDSAATEAQPDVSEEAPGVSNPTPRDSGSHALY